MTFSKIILILLLLAVAAAPLASLAAAGLVPCGLSADDTTTSYDESAPCNLCHLYILIKNILDFIVWTVVPVVAVLAISIAGFKILISGANPGQRADGYKIIKTTITGLVIMFAAWVVMSEVLFFFTGFYFNKQPTFLKSPWDQVKCSVPMPKSQ